MKILSEEYKDCIGKHGIFCEQCDDMRIKKVMTYACGEIVSSWRGCGKHCIECGSTSYRVGTNIR